MYGPGPSSRLSPMAESSAIRNRFVSDGASIR
jgi:hypothetical protein